MKPFLLEVSEKAEQEFIEAYLFYYQIRPQLADSFDKEVKAVFNYIAENSHLFPEKHKSFHEAVVKVFPFIVVYQIMQSKIIVHAIFHTSRNQKIKIKIKK